MNKLQELIEARQICWDSRYKQYIQSRDLLDMVVETFVKELGGDVSVVEVYDLETGSQMMRPAPPTWDEEIKMYGIKVMIVLQRLFNGTPEGIEFDLYAKVYQSTYWLNAGGSSNQKSTEKFTAESDADLSSRIGLFCTKRLESMKRLFTSDCFRQMEATLNEADIPEHSSSNFHWKLFLILEKHFDLSELKNLCFSLSIDTDEFQKERKSDFARELIHYTERHGKDRQLLDQIKQLRPHVAISYI